MDEKSFFQKAFSRNLGLISPEEQEYLRQSKVAIAGMGGVGGIDLITLVRLGVGIFSIADADTFELPNINRQYGANTGTFNLNKAEAMKDIAREINPFITMEAFDSGVDEKNSSDFLRGARVFIDGIDFFSIDMRRYLFQKARHLGIPAITAAPLGFSATLHIFTPEGMSFDDYFDINDSMSYTDKLIAFAVGLAPAATHLKYMNLNFVNLAERTGPSLAIACNLASALTATEVINLILRRKPVKAAPHYFQFDSFTHVYKKRYMPLGNRNPLQRLKRRWLAKKIESLGLTLGQNN